MWFQYNQYCKYIDLKSDHMKCCLNQLYHNHKQYHIWYPCNQHYKYRDQWYLHILDCLNQLHHIRRLQKRVHSIYFTCDKDYKD